MAKSRSTFVCQNCGALTNRWQGRCDSCLEWNSIVEESAGPPTAIRAGRGRVFTLEGLSGEGPTRRASHGHRRIRPRDRRRLRPWLRYASRRRARHRQIDAAHPGLRGTGEARRAGHLYFRRRSRGAGAPARGAAGPRRRSRGTRSATQVEDILATCSAGRRAALIIIDSIQTMHTETVDSAPGTVTQVRASAQALLRHAKQSGTRSSSSVM